MESKPTRKRILVIDDDSTIREVLRAHLELHNFEVDEAAFAQQAMDQFQRHAYDLITLDFRMPGLDGAKLHYVLSKGFGHGQRISDHLPQRLPPILVITGCIEDPALERLLDGENVIGVLEKPIKHHELMTTIKSIFRRIDARKASHEKLIAVLGSRVKQR